MVVKGTLAGALATALLGLSVQGQREAPKPGPPPKLFAFLSRAGGAELDHLRRYGARISVLAPNWYRLNIPTRSLSGGPTPEVVTLTRAAGAQLWPVINARLAAGEAIGGTQPTQAHRHGYRQRGGAARISGDDPGHRAAARRRVTRIRRSRRSRRRATARTARATRRVCAAAHRAWR